MWHVFLYLEKSQESSLKISIPKQEDILKELWDSINKNQDLEKDFDFFFVSFQYIVRLCIKKVRLDLQQLFSIIRQHTAELI